MLPEIIDEVYAATNNADAAKQFAEWSHSAEFDSVVKAYADCHRDPNIDDSFIRTLGQLDRYFLVCFCVIATICCTRGSTKDAEK